MILQCALGTARDHENVIEASGNGFLHHVLDGRAVNDRKHLLGAGLGGRQEPSAQSCGRDHSLGDWFL